MRIQKINNVNLIDGLVTVYANSASDAYKLITEELQKNPSRLPAYEAWKKDGFMILRKDS